MEDVKERRFPAFGNWDFYEELPITQYFESARQVGLFQGHFLGEVDDLIKLPVPTKPAHLHQLQQHPKRKKGGGGEKQQQKKKQGRVCDLRKQPHRRPRPPKAVDEDLYKIPQKLLYQKTKRKNSQGSFWSGCLGLNCIP